MQLLTCVSLTAQVLLFIKYYDPYLKSLSCLGHVTEDIALKFGESTIHIYNCTCSVCVCVCVLNFYLFLVSLYPLFYSMANLTDGTPLRLYEVG